MIIISLGFGYVFLVQRFFLQLKACGIYVSMVEAMWFFCLIFGRESVTDTPRGEKQFPEPKVRMPNQIYSGAREFSFKSKMLAFVAFILF